MSDIGIESEVDRHLASQEAEEREWQEAYDRRLEELKDDQDVIGESLAEQGLSPDQEKKIFEAMKIIDKGEGGIGNALENIGIVVAAQIQYYREYLAKYKADTGE